MGDELVPSWQTTGMGERLEERPGYFPIATSSPSCDLAGTQRPFLVFDSASVDGEVFIWIKPGFYRVAALSELSSALQ